MTESQYGLQQKSVRAYPGPGMNTNCNNAPDETTFQDIRGKEYYEINSSKKIENCSVCPCL